MVLCSDNVEEAEGNNDCPDIDLSVREYKKRLESFG